MTKKRNILKTVMIISGLIILCLLTAEVIMLHELSNQRPRYKAYWQAQAERKYTNDTLIYIALGDSTAQGIGASRPEKGYVGLLADKLSQASGKDVHVINLSSSGAKVNDVLEVQLPLLKKITIPEDAVVTVAIGSNDIRSYNQEDFYKTIDTILAKLPTQTLVADIPYFGGGRVHTGENNALAASSVIYDLTKKYNLTFVPLHEATKQSHTIRHFAADFFHPNDRAYKVWSNVFWQTMQSKYTR